jgi:hypothetical protein
VIDDLTVANRRLKERLRQYENSSNSPLEKDRLFEVRMHGLPPQKKRELEETLREFAAGLQSLNGEYSFRNATAQPGNGKASLVLSRNDASSNTSNSRPVDSAYASVAASEPPGGFRTNHAGLDKKPSQLSARIKATKIEEFLHDIPEGLFPNYSPAMTEKAKKKWVVRRLEDLFTGKRKPSTNGKHSHPLQQQEISKTAARDDCRENQRRGLEFAAEGVREAQILSTEMEMDLRTVNQPPDYNADSSPPGNDAHTRNSELGFIASLDQRPTRPLDLDPDRAQIPSQNIDYIRHLGLSAPELLQHDPADATKDAEGWIYLNLLINMAQLHIMNVTHDFVRSAVNGLSTKFQLSADGRKIRWRGGTEGTTLSSDSGVETGTRTSQDSDRSGSVITKRRKYEVIPKQEPSINQESNSNQPKRLGGCLNPAPYKLLTRSSLHYKPLFKHQGSFQGDGTSSDEAISQNWYLPAANSSRANRTSSGCEPFGHRSHSISSSKRKRDEGLVVFYNGLPFFTDLSGDRGDISPPLHVTEVGNDGYSNHTHNALGSGNVASLRPELLQVLPGSALDSSRPFKDYSKVTGLLPSELRPSTPDRLKDDGTNWIDFSPEWSSSVSQTLDIPVDFEASGLGGTRPADHFAVTVSTVRTKLDGRMRAKLSKFSAPGVKTRRILHSISRTSLDLFRSPGEDQDADSITTRLAAIRAKSPPLEPLHDDSRILPVRMQFLSAKARHLNPSTLPPPSAYFCATTSSDDSSDYDSSSGGCNDSGAMPQRAAFVTSTPTSANSTPVTQDMVMKDEDSSGTSADMLGGIRGTNPGSFTAERYLPDIPANSSAATVGGESGFSSDKGYSSSSMDDSFP